MDPQRRLIWFRRLAFLGAALAASVVVLGAWVRLTDAGLGCPDWPGCYGHVYPQVDKQRREAELKQQQQTQLQPQGQPGTGQPGGATGPQMGTPAVPGADAPTSGSATVAASARTVRAGPASSEP